MAQQPSRGARIFGYLVAVAVNAAGLWIAYRVLDWGWLPFLTEGWRDVLPVLSVSLLATVAANLGFVAYDGPVLKPVVDAVLLAISIAVSVTVWRVFPFDFAPYSFPWAAVARAVIAVAIVGAAIGIVVAIATAARAASRPQPEV